MPTIEHGLTSPTKFEWAAYRLAASKPVSWTDGRPIWHTWPEPGTNALADGFAEKLTPALRSLIGSYDRLNAAQADWLEEYVLLVAREYLPITTWVTLPTGAQYAATAAEIGDLAVKLGRGIADARAESIVGLSLGFASGGVRLRHDMPNVDNLAPLTLVDLLSQLVWHCSRSEGYRSSPGSRQRSDHVYAAAAMADLWEKLALDIFPINFKLATVRDSDLRGGGRLQVFESPSAQFVSDALVLFDPDMSVARAKTALKSVPWRSKDRQQPTAK